MADQPIEYAKNAIQQFLAERPESADTAEGIHSRWIRWPEVQEHISVTLAALEQLQALGILEVVEIGQRKIWRSSRHR